MNDSSKLSARQQGRREFLKTGGAVTAALLAPSAAIADNRQQGATGAAFESADTHCDAHAQPGQDRLQGRHFLAGRPGFARERRINFDVAVPIIERALDLGVNYIDTSSIYGGPDRWSEQYVGKVMAHRRNEAFLATKTKERTREGSMRMIEKSLELLHTDHVDLWQLHDVGTMTDVNRDLRQGRRDGGAARNAGAEGCAVSRRHRPLPSRCADGVHQSPLLSTPS